MASSRRNIKPVLLVSVQSNLSVMGLKSIHYYLLEKGLDSSLLHLPYFDPTDNISLEHINKFIADTGPSFIGLSLMSTEYHKALELSKHLKKRFPLIPVIWGGAHPTIAPETCLDYADYVCIGEGEKTVLDIAEAIAIGKEVNEIPNLCYREGGKIKRNPLYPLIEDLDGIGYSDHVPKRSYLQRPRGEIRQIDKKIFMREARYRGKKYELITSRGCAFSCTYCSNNFYRKLYGTGKIRRRSVENIISELERAIMDNPEIALIHIQDDSFMSCSKEYLAEFCGLYGDKIKRPFMVHSIPVNINLEKVGWLKEAGLAWINLGLQSGSDRVLRDIYKRNSLKDDFLKAAAAVNKYKIAGKYDVILDNPFENEDDKLETIKTLLDVPRPFMVEFFSLTFYPGTELHEKAAKECPSALEDYREKDRIYYNNDMLNKITSLAVFMPKSIARSVTGRYKTGKDSAIFKIIVSILDHYSSLFCRLINSLRVIKLAHGDSYLNALYSLPMYARTAFTKRV